MEKRGISGVVVTVLIILLAILAIALVWGFLKGFIKKSALGIHTQCLTCSLDIKKAEVDYENNLIYVKIERNTGEGNLSGIRFKFLNSTGSIIRDKETNMEELEIKIFSFDDIGDVEDISKVEIAAIVSLSGEEDICRIVDSENIREILENGLEDEGKIEAKIYFPNSTGGNAWKGIFITKEISGFDDLMDTAYTSNELDTISIEDIRGVSKGGEGGFDCSSKNLVESCNELNKTTCGNSYIISEGIPYECVWVDSCINVGANCGYYGGQQIKFKISENPADINNISVRLLSRGDATYLGGQELHLWNFTSGSWILVDREVCNDDSIPPSATYCNLTYVIKDPANFVNSLGDLYIATYSDTIVQDSLVYYAEAVVNYRV